MADPVDMDTERGPEHAMSVCVINACKRGTCRERFTQVWACVGPIGRKKLFPLMTVRGVRCAAGEDLFVGTFQRL